MSRKNWYCDQCGEKAAVFALQPLLKVKACPPHSLDLMKKHPSVFTIAAIDFIERTEDYADYVVRRDIVQKVQGTLTVLQERCESN